MPTKAKKTQKPIELERDPIKFALLSLINKLNIVTGDESDLEEVLGTAIAGTSARWKSIHLIEGVEKVAKAFNVKVYTAALKPANYYRMRRWCIVEGYTIEELYNEPEAPQDSV